MQCITGPTMHVTALIDPYIKTDETSCLLNFTHRGQLLIPLFVLNHIGFSCQ